MAAGTMKTYVALLRGINVGGNRKVPMARLRALAEGLGYGNPRTYVNSGNLVLEATASPAKVEAALEAAIEAEFGFEVPVAVRTVQELVKVRDACPYPDEAEERGNLVHAGFAKGKLERPAAAAAEEHAGSEERVAFVGRGRSAALWVDYAGGVARSKLTPAVLDRAAGGSVTMRNARTLAKLIELANG
ncbi:MAG: DUF1697 domain-containing protein [Planctomycetota bacterium]